MGLWSAFWARERKGQDLLSFSQHYAQRFGADRAAYPATDPGALLAMYGRNEVAYSAIRLMAKSANDPRLVVRTRRGAKEEWQEEEGHPLTRLMRKPNARMDGSALLRAAIVSWESTRWFFAEKIYSAGKVLVGLHPLNPCEMECKWNADRTEIISWRWRRGNLYKDYTPDELLIRRSDDWHDPAPLAVAAGAIDLDSGQTDFIRSFFENGGTPPGVIKVKRKLSPEQADEIQGRWLSKYGRRGTKRGAPAVFDEDGDYERIGSNIKELDSGSLRGFSETRIAMVWGIHPSVLGSLIGLEKSTYSNVREAQQMLWDNALMPMYKEWLGWFTWMLLTEFEPEERIFADLVQLHWDMSAVAALQDDVDARDKRARENYGSGLWRRNEARQATGVDPDPDMDMDTYRESGGGNGQEIYGYHIDQGVVDLNEARARLGFEPREDDGTGQALRRLNQQLAVVGSAVSTGIPLAAAMQLARMDAEDIAIVEAATQANPGATNE